MKNIRQDSLYKIVFNEIRNYIITNNLTPGDKLPTEHEMCEKMGVSRNVIRESLIALQMMGIVKPVAGVGNVIQDFSFDYIFDNVIYNLISDTEELIWDIRQIRGCLEISFFDEAVRLLNDNDIKELEEIYSVIETKVSTGMRANEEDRLFHTVIFRHIENVMFHSFLKIAWHTSSDLSKVKNYIKVKDDYIENHKLILQAIKAGDFVQAKRQIEQHFAPEPGKAANLRMKSGNNAEV